MDELKDTGKVSVISKGNGTKQIRSLMFDSKYKVAVLKYGNYCNHYHFLNEKESQSLRKNGFVIVKDTKENLYIKTQGDIFWPETK